MKGWRLAALVVAVFVGAVVTRVFWDGRTALASGDAALAKGDAHEALVGWRRAARWYAPGAPHVADAYERMGQLAAEAERRGDRTLALDAWRAIRSSSLATRWLVTPFAAEQAEANDHIAALMAAQEVDAGAKPEASARDRRAYHLALLQRDDAPSVPWTLVALAGFAAWVAGGFWLARRGLTAEERLDRRTATRAALLIAAGILVWMLGLYKA